MSLLQAFVDDSASNNGDRRLFLAGYLNNTQRWGLFSRAWDEQLRDAPKIEYLKMAEANNLRGQFRGWTEENRNEKLRGLARVIRHFKPMSFEVSVSRDQYYRLVRPVAPRGFGNPHFVCTVGVVTSVARYADSQGITCPIKFIFDEQDGVSADIHLFSEHMTKHLQKRARSLVRGIPDFENDKQLLPLQAADMLAWHLRREHEDCSPSENLPMANWLRSPNGHLVIRIDETHLRSWSEQFNQIPGISQMQSKGEWKMIRKEIASLLSHGFVPPHGSRWKNAVHNIRKRIASLIKY